MKSIKNNPNAYIDGEFMDKCETYDCLGDDLILYNEVWISFIGYK